MDLRRGRKQFFRSLFPCFPFPFPILVSFSLGNLKLTFLNNKVIRSPVLTKNFRASAVPQASLTRVKSNRLSNAMTIAFFFFFFKVSFVF